MTEIQRRIIELYPHYSGREIAAMTGIPVRSVNRAAHNLGLRHTDETIQRLIKKRMAALLVYDHKSPEYREKMSRVHKRLHRYERMKALSGMQPTRAWRLPTTPRRQ